METLSILLALCEWKSIDFGFFLIIRLNLFNNVDITLYTSHSVFQVGPVNENFAKMYWYQGLPSIVKIILRFFYTSL